MQIHELPTGTLGDSDYAAIDNGSTNRKLSLKSAINSLITSGISAIQSALTTAQNNITNLQNSMTTANTNIGALQTKVGSASTSNVGDGSLAGAVGNTVMGTTATTLSGAVKEHEDQIGNTDISGIGDGTITGALSSIDAVTDVTGYTVSDTYVSNTDTVSVVRSGNVVSVSFWGTQFKAAAISAGASFAIISGAPACANVQDNHLHKGAAEASVLVGNIYNSSAGSTGIRCRLMSNAAASTSYYGTLIYIAND